MTSERTPQDVLREDRFRGLVLRIQHRIGTLELGRSKRAIEQARVLYSWITEQTGQLDKAIAEAPDSPPNPCAQALEELAQQDAVIDRLQIALRVASHQPHDQLGEPSGDTERCIEVPTPDESSVFDALGIPYIAPSVR